MIVILAFNLFLLLTSGYAIWKGGKPERWAGAAFLLAAAATLLMNLPRQAHFQSLEVEVLVIDAALLALLIFLALRANRYWPLWMVAIHASTVAVHFAKLVNPSLVWPLYATAAQISSIPMQLLIAWATMRHQRRLRSFGSDRPWSGSSPT